MSYFSEAARSDARFRAHPRGDIPAVRLTEGIDAKPVIGTALNIMEVVLAPKAVAPVHAHDEEQIGFVVSGSIEFTDGETAWTLGPGDCYHAPPGAPHGATAGPGGCVVIDAFSPPRRGLRELLGAG